jgi:porphobilinogen deaminase
VAAQLAERRGRGLITTPRSATASSTAAERHRGLFTTELADLIAGRTDCAVHSLRSAHRRSEGLAIVALLEREDPQDAVISWRHCAHPESRGGADRDVSPASPRAAGAAT